MKRVFLSTAYENMIFVDTTSSCDQTSSAITRNIKNISKVNNNEYSVESETNSNTFYTVRADLAVCDCDAGKCGRFCKQLCSIKQKFGVIFPNSPRLSIHDRISLARIAMGDEINENFYMNMELRLDQTPNNDLDSIVPQCSSSNT
ncbi:unnamed protein product [Parnassius apollo]|uniref:(apollo) hypothetical protein n=1 Tax=Parnassius apollo TaxID=110799 RepID=A0A8S3WH29_PARAO|nr:unnamed protein product [Parnassius apollo]